MSTEQQQPTTTKLPAEILKEEGNTAFVAKQYRTAIERYTAALASFTNDKKIESNNNNNNTTSSSSTSPPQDQKVDVDCPALLLNLKVTLLSNRAQCHLSLERWASAAADAREALTASNYEHVKSCYRLAVALSKQTDSRQHQRDALVLCEEAMKKFPSSASSSQAGGDFSSLYENLSRSGAPAMQVGAFSHQLFSPFPNLCFVCKAPPMESVLFSSSLSSSSDGTAQQKNDQQSEKKTKSLVGSFCHCGAASYCCEAHKKLARSSAPTCSHTPVCDLIGEVGEDDAIPFRKHPKDPTNTLQFMSAVFHLFRQKHNREPAPIEYEQLRRIPFCVGCGAFPARHPCAGGCSMVSLCGAGGVCKKSSPLTVQKRHTPAMCEKLRVTAEAARQAWVRREECYARSNDNNKNEDDGTTAAASSSELVYEAIKNLDPMMSGNDPFDVYWGSKNNNATAAAAAASTAVSSLSPVQAGARALRNDSYAWPLSLFVGLMSVSKAARERLKLRLVMEAEQKQQQQKHKQQQTSSSVTAAGRAAGQVVVHVIGAEFECKILPVWEELLHRLRNLFLPPPPPSTTASTSSSSSPSSDGAAVDIRNLHIVFVGPQVRVAGAEKRMVSISSSSSRCSEQFSQHFCNCSYHVHHFSESAIITS